MKLLIIGGTSFIGLHLVEHALAAGHDVTVFNRGQTDPDVFSSVKRLTGDRERPEDRRLRFTPISAGSTSRTTPGWSPPAMSTWTARSSAHTAGRASTDR